MNDYLKKSWQDLTLKHGVKQEVLNSVYEEISEKYTENQRYYHNLKHIFEMLKLANQYQQECQYYDIICFAIWFHDVVYDPKKKNNEMQSSQFAAQKMKKMSISHVVISSTVDYILATRTHQPSVEDTDLQYFLDFDLAILGTPFDEYAQYCQDIRQEYKFVPKLLYQNIRAKILRRFLKRPKLYFHLEHLEQNARKNIELELLGKHFVV